MPQSGTNATAAAAKKPRVPASRPKKPGVPPTRPKKMKFTPEKACGFILKRQWLINYGLKNNLGTAGDDTEILNLIVNSIAHVKVAAGLPDQMRAVGVYEEEGSSRVEFCMAFAYNSSVEAMKLPEEEQMSKLKQLLGIGLDTRPRWYVRPGEE